VAAIAVNNYACLLKYVIFGELQGERYIFDKGNNYKDAETFLIREINKKLIL